MYFKRASGINKNNKREAHGPGPGRQRSREKHSLAINKLEESYDFTSRLENSYYYLPLKKRTVIHLNIFDSLHPRSWNWPSCSRNVANAFSSFCCNLPSFEQNGIILIQGCFLVLEKMTKKMKNLQQQQTTTRTTDKFWEEKLISVFSSGELKQFSNFQVSKLIFQILLTLKLTYFTVSAIIVRSTLTVVRSVRIDTSGMVSTGVRQAFVDI